MLEPRSGYSSRLSAMCCAGLVALTVSGCTTSNPRPPATANQGSSNSSEVTSLEVPVVPASQLRWSDHSAQGTERFLAAKELHDAKLDTEQLAAFVWWESLRQGNPYALGVLQEMQVATGLRNAYIALRRGTPSQPTPDAAQISHQSVLNRVLVWPMTLDGKAPWPITWQVAGEKGVPRIELAVDGELPCFGTQAFNWQFGVTSVFPLTAVQLYGPNVTLEQGSRYPNHHVTIAWIQDAFSILDLCLQTGGAPVLPEDAFNQFRFGINGLALDQLRAEYPNSQMSFMRRGDHSGYGLLFEEHSGTRHLIYRERRGQEGVLRLGILPEHQQEIATILRDFELWQPLEQMRVPRVNVEIPAQPEEVNEASR